MDASDWFCVHRGMAKDDIIRPEYEHKIDVIIMTFVFFICVYPFSLKYILIFFLNVFIFFQTALSLQCQVKLQNGKKLKKYDLLIILLCICLKQHEGFDLSFYVACTITRFFTQKYEH